MPIVVIDGPPWCMCEMCGTCEHALWDNGSIVNCPADGQAHGDEEPGCDAWEPCELLIEDCEGGPCEECDVRAWWERKAEYWERRLAAL